MDSSITSRQAIAEDADRAAQRFVETGIEQPRPDWYCDEAKAIWQAAFKRFVAFYLDHEASA